MTTPEFFDSITPVFTDAVISQVHAGLDAYNNKRAGDGSSGARENPKVAGIESWALHFGPGDTVPTISITFILPEHEFIEGDRFLHYSFPVEDALKV